MSEETKESIYKLRYMPTEEERLHLAQVTYHPGWAVFVKILDAECRGVSDDVNRIVPGSPSYTERVAGAQTVSYAINRFVGAIRKQVNYLLQLANNDKSRRENPPKEQGPSFVLKDAPGTAAKLEILKEQREQSAAAIERSKSK
jgi:hypothetical protein